MYTRTDKRKCTYILFTGRKKKRTSAETSPQNVCRYYTNIIRDVPIGGYLDCDEYAYII